MPMSRTTGDPAPRAPSRSVRAGMSIAAASATIALSYAIVRVAQVAFFPPEPDPAIVIWSTKAALFWRFWIGAYAAGMAGIGTFALSAARPEATARWIARLVAVAAIAIAAQGALLP
jgi:hypothetical protein